MLHFFVVFVLGMYFETIGVLCKAFTWASAALREGSEAANSWTVSSFGGITSFAWAQMQGCVRGIYRIAFARIEPFDKIPYLYGRLDEPGIKKRCEDQFAEAEPSKHHRVSNDFQNPGGPLYADFNAVNDDGTGISPKLEAERKSIPWEKTSLMSLKRSLTFSTIIC